ncbi:energy transducer TonB [uncultured Aquimarina sp.]|uniref:energy transducer TonB n=1 Tax=uncultured Aquimarina sp. TaxID=575652 RepID=UPI0026212DE5|nr:energy transducer TonB [uncultured Aquimarina sp.]
MEKYYKITIPKPCHKDWNVMTPSEKGRFCGSCHKTVVDFTKLSNTQIQDYLHEHKHEKVCGHFRKTQLDTIHITIPIKVMQTRYSFRKTFLLALLIAMGTTLMNCTNTEGKKQKIETVTVIKRQDSIDDPIQSITKPEKICKATKETQTLDGPKSNTVNKPVIDSTLTVEGDIDFVEMGFVITENKVDLNQPVPAHLLETFPAFPNVNKQDRHKDTFTRMIKDHIQEEFNTRISKELFLTGIQRIYVLFEISKQGVIENIKIRAPHPKLEKEAFRVIQTIPKLIPGKYQNKPVRTTYKLPILFKTKE